MPFIKKGDQTVFEPNEIELVAINAWGVSGLARFFARYTGPSCLTTDEENKLFQQEITSGQIEAIAACNGLLRGITVTEYIRLIIEARTRHQTGQRLE